MCPIQWEKANHLLSPRWNHKWNADERILNQKKKYAAAGKRSKNYDIENKNEKKYSEKFIQYAYK